MSELIIGPAVQERFPREDLSEENAALLELWLSNKELLNALHRTAEDARPLYRLGHASIAEVLRLNQQFTDDQLVAISWGVSLHEAISVTVNPQPGVEIDAAERGLLIANSLRPLQGEAVGTLDALSTTYRREQPHAAGVMAEASGRLMPAQYEPYAIAGAALSRHIELQAA